MVERLIAAGAVLVGKTNLDQFATGLVGTRTPYGACGSRLQPRLHQRRLQLRSAVAVAAGLVAFALGTDTAGSGRVPAALNHLVGLKPTKGRWSTRGVVPACRTLDCVTVLASTAADAALVDEVVAGFDPDGSLLTAGARRGGRQRRCASACRARPAELAGRCESARLFAAAMERLTAAGRRAWSRSTSPPLCEAAALSTTALGRRAHRGGRGAAAHRARRDRADGARHPAGRPGDLRGRRVRGEYALRGFQRDAEALWAASTPCCCRRPPPSTASRGDGRAAALNANLGRYTNFVNLLDMSAIAVPAGFRDNATGFGVSLIGPAWADRALLALARRYEEIAPMPAGPAARFAGVVAEREARRGRRPPRGDAAALAADLPRRAPGQALQDRADLPALRHGGAEPPKPALVHVGEGGAAIEVEVYELDVAAFGSFVAEVPPPLAIGTVTLEDGSEVKGFVAEPRALAGAEDITALGGWRASVNARSSPPRP